ncbi:BON domain-containing protein [Dyella telluris]|uniref:BON domain-containing protein n=1 Tax=Dyella telluris TaxID=2763498 RepID=A0A7G8Q0K7_9GAMM|nr:BON domain-containing protein [Dyella telluris]QNK00315.1 BON domain-containing protein [Dyella telluris]
MRTNNLLRKALIAAGLVTALSALPFAQVAAQSAPAQQQAQDAAAQRQAQDAAMQQQQQAQDSAMHDKSNRTVAGKTDDTWITTKVKSELATTNGIKSNDITVSTTDGVVSLTGTAGSTKEKTKVEQIAKKVKGVKSVDASGLTVSDTAK